MNHFSLDENEDGCPFSGFSTESILADIGMNFYATVDVQAYIHAAVKSEMSSANESDTKDAVPLHCGSPSVRRRFTEWDAAGAGAVFPHCVKIEDAASAKAAFAMAAPDANAKARAALEADEAELLAASDAAADAESEADAAIAAAADAAAAEAAEDVAAAAHAADARDVDNSSLDNSRYRLQSEPSKTGTLRTRRGSCDTYIPENKVLFIRDDGQGLHILFKPEDLKNNLIVLLPVDDPSPQIMRASRLLRGSSTVEGVLLGSILPLFSSVPHDHYELEVFGGARTTRDGNTLDMFMGSKVFTFTACSSSTSRAPSHT